MTEDEKIWAKEVAALHAKLAIAVEALRPFADQDCESWGCVHAIDGPIICEPELARKALAQIEGDTPPPETDDEDSE